MTRLPPLTALRTFEAVVRLGSFARAADELHVTQSAVSHQVRQLEHWFGFDLIDRRGRGWRATAGGEQLARACARGFADIATACAEVARQGRPAGLTIAAIPSFAAIWLIPRLNRFWQVAPETGVRLVYALHGSTVDFDAHDIELRYGTGRWPGCRVTPLIAGAAAPVCAPAYLERAGRLDEAGAIARADLLHDSDEAGWRAWLEAAGAAPPARLPGPVFQDFNLLHAAALAGHGIALAPVDLLAGDLASGRLVRLHPLTVKQDEGYCLLEPEADGDPGRRQSAARFKAWLAAELPGNA